METQRTELDELVIVQHPIGIALERLELSEGALRETNEAALLKLMRNIKLNGQIQPLHIREEGEKRVVFSGRKLLTALTRLGYTHGWAVMYGGISKEKALILSIELSESEFLPDWVGFARTIKELAMAVPIDELEKALPFAREEIRDLIALARKDWKELTSQKPTTSQQGAFF